jgi:CDP-diacylglycerol---serine O-phosphatidyltransferase
MKRRWMHRRPPFTREQYRRGMYIIPSSFTVSNIFCGFYSITSAIRGEFELAGILIGIAMILDALDGRIARLTKTTSDFGVQLDSLADAITFGVAPGVLCYQWSFSQFDQPTIHRAGWLVCFLFLVCAASRLARFNVQTTGSPDKRYFTGMPTPAAAGVVGSTIYCFPDAFPPTIYFAVATLLVMFLLSYLMVSRVKYRTFKDINMRQPHSWRVVSVIALIIFGIALDPHYALLIISMLYALSGMIGYSVARRKKLQPAPAAQTIPAQGAPAFSPATPEEHKV